MNNDKEMNFDLNLEIDRLFTEVREKLIKFSIQNENQLHIEIIRASEKPYMYTVEPKRFFIDKQANKLKDNGFKIYFRVETLDEYEKLKTIIFSKFKDNLFISPKITSKPDATFISGVIKFKNIR